MVTHWRPGNTRAGVRSSASLGDPPTAAAVLSAKGVPEILIGNARRFFLVPPAPMSIDPVPAIALELVATRRTDPLSVLGKTCITTLATHTVPVPPNRVLQRRYAAPAAQPRLQPLVVPPRCINALNYPHAI